MSRTPDDLKAATNLIRRMIRDQRPDGWWYHQKDQAGHKIYTHYHPNGYLPPGYTDPIFAEVIYETYSWCDYEFLDEVNDALEKADLPFCVEYYSSVELAVMRV